MGRKSTFGDIRRGHLFDRLPLPLEAEKPDPEREARRAAHEATDHWLYERYWDFVNEYEAGADAEFWAAFQPGTFDHTEAELEAAKTRNRAAHLWAKAQFAEYEQAARRMAQSLYQGVIEAIMAETIKQGDRVLVRDFGLVGVVISHHTGNRRGAGYYVVRMPDKWVVTRPAELLKKVG